MAVNAGFIMHAAKCKSVKEINHVRRQKKKICGKLCEPAGKILAPLLGYVAQSSCSSDSTMGGRSNRVRNAQHLSFLLKRGLEQSLLNWPQPWYVPPFSFGEVLYRTVDIFLTKPVTSRSRFKAR